MIVTTENILDTALTNAKQLVESAIGFLVENGNRLICEVKNEYVPLIEDLIKNFTGDIKGTAFGKEVETLDMATLIDFARKYIVANSNEIVAVKAAQQDCTYIYLAYSVDRQLLPVDENKYLIIKTQSLAEDVAELFAESDVVILK